MKAVLKMTMKLSPYSAINPQSFNCFQEIAAHVGGMTRALLRHSPINWTFHRRGICRAIASRIQTVLQCLSIEERIDDFADS
jgi:hypothetical protein